MESWKVRKQDSVWSKGRGGDIQGGPSGRGIQFVDKKLKVLPQY